MARNPNKKKEKAFYAKARNTWTRRPTIQVVENGKAYNRKREKRKLHQTLMKGDDGAFYISLSYLFCVAFILYLKVFIGQGFHKVVSKLTTTSTGITTCHDKFFFILATNV